MTNAENTTATNTATTNTTIDMSQNANTGTFEPDLDSIGVPYFDAGIIVENKAAADAIVAIAEIYSVKTTVGATMVEGEPKIEVTLHSVDDEQLAQIERKLQISNWSKNIIAIAGRARDGITNMGDFALNGALVPAAGAAVEATARTAQIAGVAAIRLGSVVTSAAISEGRMAVKRLAADPVVWKAAGDVKNLASDVKSGISALFGAIGKGGASKFTRK